jgi:CubicO group peptidase (beta-lactamase class C family)
MATEKINLSVAEYKAMLGKGVPIEFVRRAKKLFCVRHFSADALDNKESGEADALYYSNFMWEFLPSAIVPASKTKFDLLRELNPKWDNITFSDVNGKPHPTLKEFIDSPDSKLQAAMMIHKGKIVYETYPGMRPTDLHIWMSNTKPLAGTLVLDLIMNGKIDPKAPITQYVPELKGSAWDGVPVQAVLTMTAGLNADDMAGNMFVAGSMEQRYYQASFGEIYNGKIENWLDVIREAKKIAEPYKLYQYASMNTQVLSIAVENVTHKKLVDYLYERLFQYAGTREMVVNLFPDGSIHSATAMNSTLEDMARFGLLFTPTYKKITGKEVISQKLIDYMFSIKVPVDIFNPSAVGKMAVDELGNQKVCGSGAQFDFLWDDGALAKLGHNNQGIYIDPAREFVGVYFGASIVPNYPIGYMRAAALSLNR